MRRPGREAGRVAACIVLALSASLATVPARAGVQDQRPRAAPADAERPNIVLVMTDDQNRVELRWMPKTRKLLGNHGVTFPNALSPAPLCCPARAMTLTGQYGQNNGVRSNAGRYGGFHSLLQKGNTLGSWLQDVGYRTALVGKYLNGYEGAVTPPQDGWTRWYPAVGNIYGYRDTVFLTDSGRENVPGNVTPYIARRTAQLAREFAATDDPFFIWVSHIAPHGATTLTTHDDNSLWGPPRPTAEHADVLGGVTMPSRNKPSFNAAGRGGSPYPRPPMGPDRVRRIQAQFTGRIRTLQDVDDAVADLVAVLRETGELSSTYIVFVSDNGYLLGEHRLAIKNVLYREAMEIPLVVRVPGATSGTTSGVPATTVDLTPTILDLADAQPGRVMDGRSFAAALDGRRPAWRTTQLVQTGSGRTVGPQPGWAFRGVRTPRYTLMRRAVDGARFLFDRRRDKHELVDVARVARYRPVLRALQHRLDELVDCAGEGCNRSFRPLPHPRRS